MIATRKDGGDGRKMSLALMAGWTQSEREAVAMRASASRGQRANG